MGAYLKLIVTYGTVLTFLFLSLVLLQPSARILVDLQVE